MLLEFTVVNFKSFREKQVFSMLPSSKLRTRLISPLQASRYAKMQALPTSVIYGPNNAGKSNLVKAFKALQNLVRNSGNFNSDRLLDENNFFDLDIQTQNQATSFEIDFIAPNNKRYVYNLLFTKTHVLTEELFVYNISETGITTLNTLYKRNKQDIKFTALKGVRENISFNKNQLFLSRGDIEGNEMLKEVYSFFSSQLKIFLYSEDQYLNVLEHLYPTLIDKHGQKIIDLIDVILQETDTGILGIEGRLPDTDSVHFSQNIPVETRKKILARLPSSISTRHKLFDGEEEVGYIPLPLILQSTGTRKILGLVPIIILALDKGSVLIIDEMTTSLHTEMVSWLIDLFNQPETNPNKAQLIFTTHDISLLDRQLYDRDQIHIVEKNKYGASESYSFADITGLRPNSQLSDYYETGRLGGVPHIVKPYLTYVISQYLNHVETEVQ